MTTATNPTTRRFASALALTIKNGGINSAIDFAERAGRGEIALILRDAVAPLTTTNDGAALVPPVSTEWVARVFERSALGPARAVPVGVDLIKTVTGATAYWRGQGAAIPVSAMSIGGSALAPLRVGAILAISKELQRLASVGAQDLIAAEAERACRDAIELAFLDPTNNGEANVKPASITNGLTPITSAGIPDYDFESIIADYDGDLSTAVLVMRPQLAAQAHSERHQLIGARGGELLGVPVIATRNAPAGVIVLYDTAGVVVGEPELRLATSTDASLTMTDDASGAATQVSLFQTDLVGILFSIHTNWKTMRPGSVAMIANADYGTSG